MLRRKNKSLELVLALFDMVAMCFGLSYVEMLESVCLALESGVHGINM